MKNTDPRLWFGLAVLVGIIGLNLVIALGNVTEQNSYGLDKGMTVLAMLATGWSGWAFAKTVETKEPNDTKPNQ